MEYSRSEAQNLENSWDLSKKNISACGFQDPEYDVICFGRGSENPLYGQAFAVKKNIRILEQGKSTIA